MCLRTHRRRDGHVGHAGLGTLGMYSLNMYVCMYVPMYTCIYACMYAQADGVIHMSAMLFGTYCMNVCVHVCMYAHTETNR
jgi:hypothetical protein